MLLRAVRSVVQQTYCDWELIVIDDGSTPPTELDWQEIFPRGHEEGNRHELCSLREKFTLIRQEHKGVAAARNRALTKAKGEWIALLDSDDEWLPDKLERQLAYMSEHKDFEFSQCREIWYRHGKKVNMLARHAQPLGEAFNRSCELCVISSSSVLLPTAWYERYGNYAEELVVCEDYEFWLRITAKHPVGLVPEPLVIKYGGHEDQLSHSYPAMDRFRVYGLLKLLSQQVLTDKQRVTATKEIAKKAGVLRLGAVKRNLNYELWQDVLDFAGEPSHNSAQQTTVEACHLAKLVLTSLNHHVQ